MAILDQQETGVLAALAAPFCMAVGFIVWDNTWKTSSAFSLNMFKCNLASIVFLIFAFVLGFSLKEENINFEKVGWLVLSGIVGIIIGDLFWLEALRRLGAFQVLVIDTIKPFCAALLGLLVLGEKIHSVAYAGILLTVGGVLIVSVEQDKKATQATSDPPTKEDATATIVRRETLVTLNPSSSISMADNTSTEANTVESGNEHNTNERDDGERLQYVSNSSTINGEEAIQENTKSLNSSRRKGYLLAVVNVVLDTYGSLLTKQHGANMTTWAINLVRFGSSGIVMVIIACCTSFYYSRNRQSATSDGSPSAIEKDEWYKLPRKSPKVWAQVCLGVLFVTFFCPALSNYALFQIALALALTLTSISPLYALFLEWALYGNIKKPTWRAFVGATLAVGGVVILGIFNTSRQ